MDCNKDEAIRAKELAKKKMSSKDYAEAQKMIVKAQKLYPSIENVIQMLTVCEVHSSAEHRVQGLDPDWYSVLQIEQTADEAAVKKQFRKLALQLHPDKNKFPGAEAAFKLITEAQRVLCDQTTRQTFDWRRSGNMKAGPSGQQKQSQPQPTRNNDPSKQPDGMYSNPASTGTTPRFTSTNPQQQKQHQTQPMFANGQQTFWTACPFCSSRCQSHRDKMKKAIRCQSCKEPFIAFELENQGMPSVDNNRSSPRKKEGLSHNGQKMSPENMQGNHGSAVPVSKPPTKTGRASEDVNVRAEAGAQGNGISAEHKLSGTKNRKIGRSPELEEDSVRCDTGRSSNTEEDGNHEAPQISGINSGCATCSTSRPSRNNYPTRQPDGMYSNPASTGTTRRFTSTNPQQQKQHQTQPMFANGQQTFWTACPFCSSRCQSHRDKMKKAIYCQSCKEPFIAFELKNHGMTSVDNNRSSPRKKEGSSRNGQKMGPENMQGNRCSAVPVSKPPTETGRASVVGGAPKPKAKEDVNVRAEAGAQGKGISAEYKLSGTKNRKRGRNPELEEDSVRCNTGRSSIMQEDGDQEARQNYGINSGCATRSTSRRKDDASFQDNVCDDNDIARGSMRKTTTVNEPGDKVEKYERGAPLEESTPDGNAENCKKNGEEVAADDNNYEVPGPVVVEVPDPDFYDFDKDRSEECFAFDQMWAIFDNIDGMPRFYAWIKKVYSPFKVVITWLDFVARDPDETAGLPVACGKFKHGKTDTIDDIYIFSHRIVWEKGVRNSYMIYPRKGETWALYKNWNITWSSDPNNHREFEFELVVVLSDYTHESGILVARLVKVKGFVCLFMPTKNNGTASFQIPSNETLRFSHRVPSFRTNGTEREDVPEGYFELDPASVPSNLEEVSDFIDVKADGKFDGSLKFVSEEKPRTPKMRKNPEGKSTLNGSSLGRTRSSSRMLNEYYKNADEENIEKSAPKTFSASRWRDR